MCTLTVVPLTSDTVRLAFNRDESRTRAAGLPPQVRPFGPRRAALPTDPTSGGTWLAVNDAGLALAMLNVNPQKQDPSPRPPPPRGEGGKALGGVATLPTDWALPGSEGLSPPSEEGGAGGTLGSPSRTAKGVGGLGPALYSRSRGAIIPALLEYDAPSAALAACERLTYSDFAPFRLVLVGQGVVADVRWDGREPMVVSRLLGGRPRMFTSSGLGDHLVESVRRELFDELFAGPPETWAAAQHAFHRHRWPGRAHLSVNMSRDTARTVSHAVIDFTPAEATFTYHADAPDASAEVTTVRLPLVNGVA